MPHTPPPSVYLNWPAPNYDTTVTRGRGLTISNSILIFVVFFVVLARCYTRLRITRSWGIDDVFIVLSLIPALGLMSCSIVNESLYDWNRHVWDARPENLRGGFRLEFVAATLYISSSIFTKLSVVFFCRRLLSLSHPDWYRWGLNGASLTIVFGNVLYILVFCNICQPLSAYWDQIPPTWQPSYEYTCLDIASVWLGGSILNTVVDAVVWVIPLPIVYQLHLPMRQRFAVMALFGVGICLLAASITKTYYIHAAFIGSYDVTWVGWPTWICGAVEIALGIICASAPSLRPFFSHFFPRPCEVFGGARHSYAKMSRGADIRKSYYDEMNIGMATPLSPMAPVHQRLESVGSEEFKPWAYNNSRGSSRNTSRRGSLGKLETNLAPNSRSTSSTTTPATLTPGSPVSKRLTPVREVEPMSSIFDDNFKFNQTAALPPPSEDEDIGPDEDAKKKSPIDSPAKAALPLWWQRGQRPRTASNATKGSFGRSISPKLERHPSNKSERRASKLTTDVAGTVTRSPETQTPVSAVSASTKDSAVQRHSRKPSAQREFEMFNFSGPATSSRHGSDATERLPAITVSADSMPPPSYGEFVENNSWIQEDKSTSDNADVSPGIAKAL